MENKKDIIKHLKKNPTNVRFADLCKVCKYYFGKARQSGTSHKIYKTPWQGDPRVNIKNNRVVAQQAINTICSIMFNQKPQHIL